MKKLVPGIMALALTVLLAGSANAVQLSGSFGITGNFLPANGNLVTTTALDFIACNGASCVPPPQVPTATPGVAGQFLVTSATGDFSGLLNSVGNIKDFTFSGPSSVGFPNVPVAAFEIVGALTYDLNTISVVCQSLTCSSGQPGLQLSGTGIFHAPGFDDTFGNWTFLGQRACQAFGCPPAFIETFVFTANNTIPPPPGVPEPSLLLLIGVGLVGLAAWGRVRMRNTK